MSSVIAKSLQGPDGSRAFLDDSRRDLVTLGTVTVGRGVYRPGWRWSVHARQLAEEGSAAHVGYIVSGRMIIRGPDGVEVEVGPGDAFEAPPGHDAWVLGDEPCVALDFAPDPGVPSNRDGNLTLP
jgi:mannose-6-phosphate isomerase-like protein (cupin superfamily)